MFKIESILIRNKMKREPKIDLKTIQNTGEDWKNKGCMNAKEELNLNLEFEVPL